jgi:adenylosuccinate synthase
LRSFIVIDLGFGDAGKGLLTDFLARQYKAGVVVRYNGGAQAGHNVIAPDGRHHTFSQFGSGTFIPGVRTYLSRHVVIHPAALLAEGDALQNKGVSDAYCRLRINDHALVITPFHQAANRIRELVRGDKRHGSCGVGIGETVGDANLRPEDRILAGDLARPALLYKKAQRIREQKREEIADLLREYPLQSALAREWSIFECEDIIDQWVTSIARITELGLVVSESVLKNWMKETETFVFEGAQGVLLDADAGFHPYTTWSCCTDKNALEIIRELSPSSDVYRIGVMRSYVVRHGPGPLPTETDGLSSTISEHNQYSEWQGQVRYGWFDAVLARYALHTLGGTDYLAITHMDLLPRLKAWHYCAGYSEYHELISNSIDNDISEAALEEFCMSTSLSLAQRAKLTKALFKVKPNLNECVAEEASVIQKIESLLNHPVDMISRGPTAMDIQILNSIGLG